MHWTSGDLKYALMGFLITQGFNTQVSFLYTLSGIGLIGDSG
jgi:hypothetical protein